MKNSAWAFALIDQLVLQGVTAFCVAPGSRSACLALAAARHPKASVYVHFDERGLGFFALGLALASQMPAALIVTSGTAVGNLMPAVMEAHHSEVPMLILTADRPPELLHCGANQTTDQLRFFQRYTKWSAELGCPNEDCSESYLRSEAAYAVSKALERGVVHLNCAFREPLYEPKSAFKEGTVQHYFAPLLAPGARALNYAKELLSTKTQGVILLGKLNVDLEPIYELAQRLQWPIFADLLSQARTHPSPVLIQHFDFLLRTRITPRPDCIFHFGGRLTSKALYSWLENINGPLLHISDSSERIDPLHLRPTRITCDPRVFCKQLLPSPRSQKKWLEQWQILDSELQEQLSEVFNEPHPLTEAHFMNKLGKHLPQGWIVFLANSMPIRDAERFLFPKEQANAFYANRGVSGIDGQIATAAGIALHLKAPLVAILGDQSTLHDLNSLALLKKIKTPVLLVIFNNFGGGIFSHLPVAQDPDQFERLFAAEHSLNFSHAAGLFNLPYTCLSKEPNFDFFFHCKEVQILEIQTNRKENASFQKQLLQKCTVSKIRERPIVWTTHS